MKICGICFPSGPRINKFLIPRCQLCKMLLLWKSHLVSDFVLSVNFHHFEKENL
jgi:hypothetical protein